MGAWLSVLLNFGGTGPDPTVVLADAEVEATERELQPVGTEKGPPLEGASELGTVALEENIATDGVDEGEAQDRACLSLFVAVAFVCQLQEHSLLAERVKKIPDGTCLWLRSPPGHLCSRVFGLCQKIQAFLLQGP